MHTFALTLNEIIAEFEHLESTSVYSIIGEVIFANRLAIFSIMFHSRMLRKVFTCVYMFLGTLMVMILIAMMDYTQEETNETENEWIRQVFNEPRLMFV